MSWYAILQVVSVVSSTKRKWGINNPYKLGDIMILGQYEMTFENVNDLPVATRDLRFAPL